MTPVAAWKTDIRKEETQKKQKKKKIEKENKENNEKMKGSRKNE
jgi:hypothetical protein